MRLMGPVHLGRIARLLSTRFSSHKTGPNRLEMRSLQKFLLIRSAVFLLGVAIPSPNLAHAQTVFHFSKEVHWGDTVLPPGDYVVTSLDVVNSGAVLTFARPDKQSASTDTPDLPGQQAVSGDTPSANGGFFTIRNPRNQTVPDAEAQTIYLSACRVVEQEFSRTDPVRPRLTLVLGADRDSLYYPKSEIRLRKWNKYKFAQGVVMLALDDLMPEDKKLSLSKLAVLEADSTIDVRLLKSSRSWLPAGPHN